MKNGQNDKNEFAEQIGAVASWPTQIEAWANILEEHNPSFDKQKFIRRATAAWERNYEPPVLDDEIPY